MDILRWLARSAARLRRLMAGRTTDNRQDRMLAARDLRTRLSPHLMRDIGMDDG
jgi:hypothetical protein